MQDKPLSLRKFAALLGVRENAVRKAIARGRLERSVGRWRGQPCIVDEALAREEWRANAAKTPKGDSSVTMAEANRRVALERARGMRIVNNQKRGRLIAADLAARIAFEASRVIRDALLNLPARLAPECAAETDAAKIHERLDVEIRLALEAAAGKIAGGAA